MFEYNIFPDNSRKEFTGACKKIEDTFHGIVKNKLLIDVDGTTIQTYTLDGKDIDVFDDYDVGAVFIKSEIDLKHVFG